MPPRLIRSELVLEEQQPVLVHKLVAEGMGEERTLAEEQEAQLVLQVVPMVEQAVWHA